MFTKVQETIAVDSNPPLSAIFYKGIVMVTHKGTHKFQSR
jgi:hypothetical protein